MRPIRLELHNFGAFTAADIPLNEVVLAAIIGVNGVGKTTLLDGMKVALYGAKFGPLDELIRQGSNGYMLTFDFVATDGHTYRVVREQTKSQKASLFRRGTVTAETSNPGWGSVCEAQPTIVDAKLLELVGCGYAEFCLAHHIPQGGLGAFALFLPSKRKEWIMGNLPMGVYGKLLEAVKVRVKVATERRTKLEGQLSALTVIAPDELALLKGQSDSVYESLQRNETAAESTQKLIDESREKAAIRSRIAGNIETAALADLGARTRVADLQKELRTVREGDAGVQIPGISHLESAILVVEDRLSTPLSPPVDTSALQTELDEITDLKARRSAAQQASTGANEAWTRAVENETTKKTAAEAAERSLEAFESQEAPICSRCHQAIEGEAYEDDHSAFIAELIDSRAALDLATAAVDAAKLNVAATDKAIDELPPVDDDREQEIRKQLVGAEAIQQQHAERKVLEERLVAGRTKLSERLVRLVELEISLTAAIKSAEDTDKEITQLRAELDDCEAVDVEASVSSLQSIKREIDRLREESSNIEHKIANNTATIERRKIVDAEIAEINTQLADLQLLANAYGKNGIPARIIGGAVAEIEDEANAFLESFHDGISVEFVMQAEGKGGNLKETLDIMVTDALGTRRYERYSGGEKTRVNFAISIALSRFLAAHTGTRVESFVVDEPEYLDVAGAAELVACLHKIAQSVPFVALVSHVGNMTEGLPQSIEVKKSASGSTVALNL